MTTREQLEADLDNARALPDGDAKVAELERIASHADALGAVRVAFDTRYALIEAYSEHTERWRMLPHFGWCLATFDRDQSLFDDWDAEMLRWYHKWAIGVLRATPRVSLEQTMAALDDMERRFREGGHSLHAIYSIRCRTANHVGDEAEARRFLDLWQTAEVDDNSDCSGCDPSRLAGLYTEWGEWDRAVAAIEPVLTGVVGCKEQPERALVASMVPYLRLGRFAEAAKAHVQAYRRHRYERDSLPYLSDHLRFCALTGHLERGLEILAEHLPWLDRPLDEMSAMDFYASAAAVCRLAAAGGLADRTVFRPEFGDRPAEDVPVADLGVRLAARALEIAAQFDARNRTGHQTARIERLLADEPLTSDLELPPDASPRDPARFAPPPEGRQDVIVPLSVTGIAAAVSERGDRFLVEDDVVVGGWGDTLIRMRCAGERGRSCTPV